jgi:hypothetical protein
VDPDPGSDPDPQHWFQESECSEKLRTDATDNNVTKYWTQYYIRILSLLLYNTNRTSRLVESATR